MVQFLTVLGWVKSLAEVTPEAVALANELKGLFGPQEQEELQRKIEEVSARNDAAHEARQRRFREAQEDDGA